MGAADDRERALQDEIARLQRLQKLAEKVHKDTKLCEGYLDDVDQRLMEVRTTLATNYYQLLLTTNYY